MISGWLLKMVVGFALLGFVLVEAGSPLVTRAQLDGVAHDAADNAALELLERSDPARARAVAEGIVTEKEAVLKSFSIDQAGVHVVVEKEARSVLFKKAEQLKSWYDVEVSATASTVRR